MLTDALDPIRPFMEFLNNKKLCSIPCKIIYLPDNDTVKGETGIGFAAYVPCSLLIYVAGDLSGLEDLTPEEQFEAVLQSIAHEYIHHIQNIECRDFDEDEAHARAEELVREYYAKERDP